MNRLLRDIGLLAGLALAVACARLPHEGASGFRPSPGLSAIDSLMWQQPDSAFSKLLLFADTAELDSLDAFDQHYFQLLVAELLYKNDYAQSNRTELQQAVAYYDSLNSTLADNSRSAFPHRNPALRHPRSIFPHCGLDPQSPSLCDIIPFLSARAHYINGVGYYENDSAVEACAEYLKALEVMEDRFEEKELAGKRAQFMALAHTRLTDLYSDFYLHEQAIHYARNSLLFYQKQVQHSWHSVCMFCEIGTQFEMMNCVDSADYYYKKAANTLQDSSLLLYRDIVTLRAYLLYRTEKNAEIALNQIREITALSENELEKNARYLTIGEIFYHEQLLDSAWYYLNIVYNNSQSVAAKKQAAEWMVDICKAQGRDEEILEYANYLVPFANQEENQSAIKSKLVEEYNVFQQNKLECQHQIMIRRNMKLGIVLISTLLVIIMAILSIYLKRKQHFKKQLEAESYAHLIKQKALSARLKTSNDTLRTTLKRIEEIESENKTKESSLSCDLVNDNYETFMKTPLCQEIVALLEKLHSDKRKTLKTNSIISEYKDFALSNKQLNLLTKVVESAFPSLQNTLKTIYPNLNRNEWLHCCFYLMQLSKMDICVLIQEPYYTCRRCTLKLEDVFGCSQGISEFLMEKAKIL